MQFCWYSQSFQLHCLVLIMLDWKLYGSERLSAVELFHPSNNIAYKIFHSFFAHRERILFGLCMCVMSNPKPNQNCKFQTISWHLYWRLTLTFSMCAKNNRTLQKHKSAETLIWHFTHYFIIFFFGFNWFIGNKLINSVRAQVYQWI